MFRVIVNYIKLLLLLTSIMLIKSMMNS